MLLVSVTTFPQTFAAGTWPVSAFNTGRFRLSFTTTIASSAVTNGDFKTLAAAADNGGLWYHRDAGVMYIGLFNSVTGASIFDIPVEWGAGGGATVDVNHIASTVTISGASSGNGVYAFTPGGNAFSNVTLGVAVYGGGGFSWSGTISSIDDGVTGATLVADPSSMPITSSDASLLRSSRVVADSATLPLASTSVNLLVSYRLNAESSPVSIASVDAALVYGSEDPYLQAESSVIALVSDDASLRRTAILTATADAVALTSVPATLVHSYPIIADASTVPLQSTDAAFRVAHVLSADSASVALVSPDAALSVATAIEVGATGIDFQIYGLANRNASVTLTTQTSNSIVVVATGGRTTDVTQGVADNKSNTFSRVSTQDYPDFPGYGVVVETTRPPMTGGASHTFTVPVTLFDENSTIAIEVKGVVRVATYSWRNVANSSGAASLTSLPVTVDKASMLLAFWFGSGPVFSPPSTPFQATPSAGFTPGPSYLVNNSNGEVQCASAYRVVTPNTPTAYDVTWTQFPNQGAQLILLALQGPATLSADGIAVSIINTNASLTRGYRFVADSSAALDLTSIDATLRRGYQLAADPLTLAITAANAGIFVGRRVQADSSTLPFASSDASLLYFRRLDATLAAVPLSSSDAQLLAGRKLVADSALVSTVSIDASLVWSGHAASYTLEAESASVILTSQDASLVRGRTLVAESAAFPISSQDAAFRRHWVLIANSGAIALLARDATLTWSGETPAIPVLHAYSFESAVTVPRTYTFVANLRR